ncbi:MAG TPA: hypothetical protein QF716_00115 [Candidatus Thalassarchaeaceae archaeon]|nr:hypothetical protein [Candidatus Thalassarchaeaceae archaeon]
MASATTLVLTVALLLVPILLLVRDWMPTWSHKIPFAIISLAILLRIHAFWTINLTDAQVVGYLPEDVSGLATILHIFDGPSGLMLGLLLGFSAGIALAVPNPIEHRWATLCWILLLGWGMDSDAFATIASTPLTNHPSTLNWYSAIYPFLGLGLSLLVIPTLVNIDTASTPRLVAAISICIIFLDISSSPVAWMLMGLMAHRQSSLRIHTSRGAASHRRWLGLMTTFFLSAVLLIIGLSWSSIFDGIWISIWPSRWAIGWILLCGIGGAMTPTMGFDANPRPEAWGFHTGIILAPALMPGIALIQHAQLPIFVIAIVMPIIATLPEYRPSIDWKRRGLEAILLISILPFALFLTDTVPVSLVVVIALLPLLIKFKHSVGEEE